MSKPLRILTASDSHCGHEVGLTPPNMNYQKGSSQRAKALFEVRDYTFKWFDAKMKLYEPFDVTIFNADLIDGKGKKSGSTEQIYTDRNDQCDMFVDIANRYELGYILMSYGTPYHVGYDEDWEDQIARTLSALKIGSEDNFDANGCIINYKHKVSRSVIPHGRHTSIARAYWWNLIWAARKEYPLANILVRSHVHYFRHCGGTDWWAFTTPALQAYGTKYGTRQVDGTVDCGFVVLDVDKNGGYTWNPEILRFPMKEPVRLPTKR